MPTTKNHKLSYLTGSAQLIIGIFFLFVAFLAHYTISDFKEHAVEVSGKVARFQKVFNKRVGKEEVYPAIEYNHEGSLKTYFLQTRFNKSSLKKGQTVTVLIDPRNRDRIKIGNFEDMYSSITMLFFMGSFFFMMGLFTTSYFGKKQKLKAQILEQGRVVFAKVIEIREEKVMRFGKHKAYKFIAEYLDPFKGKTYHFESEYLYGDWTSDIRPELVKVFVLAEDETQYIMDLNSFCEEVHDLNRAA